MSFSQKSGTQGSQKARADDLSEEQLDSAVLNVTAFLLCDMRSKRKLRKDDVVTNALNKSAKQYGRIMKRVSENLSNVFGLQITKVPESDDAFIIVNKHRKAFAELTEEMSSELEIQEDLILTVALSSVFMSRGTLYESHLLTILETIGFLSDKFYGSACERKMKDHVTKLVKNVFVRQMYLDAYTVPKPEQPQNPPLPEKDKKVIAFQWGFRALLEVDVDHIVDYLVKVHDGNKPAGFPVGHLKELKARQDALRAQFLARA